MDRRTVPVFGHNVPNCCDEDRLPGGCLRLVGLQGRDSSAAGSFLLRREASVLRLKQPALALREKGFIGVIGAERDL